MGNSTLWYWSFKGQKSLKPLLEKTWVNILFQLGKPIWQFVQEYWPLYSLSTVESSVLIYGIQVGRVASELNTTADKDQSASTSVWLASQLIGSIKSRIWVIYNQHCWRYWRWDRRWCTHASSQKLALWIHKQPMTLFSIGDGGGHMVI